MWGAAAVMLSLLATSARAEEGGAGSFLGTSGPALTDESLGHLTAKEDVNLVSQAQQSSTVANNSVVGNSLTGAVQFSDSAFENISGMAVVSANSGNNVSINAALSVAVSINPRP